MTVCNCLCSLLKLKDSVRTCCCNPDEDVRFMAFWSTAGENGSSGHESAYWVSHCKSPAAEVSHCIYSVFSYVLSDARWFVFLITP